MTRMLQLAIPVWRLSPEELQELVQRGLREKPVLEAARPEAAPRPAVSAPPRAPRPRGTPRAID